MYSNNKLIKALSTITVSIWLSACGGGGGGGSSSTPTTIKTPPANKAPIIESMDEQTVEERQHFTFTASAKDTDGTITNQSWVQKSGIEIYNTNINENTLSFLAPNIAQDQTVVFTFMATDDDGTESQQDLTINITALKNITDVEFADPNLQACVIEAAEQLGENADITSFDGDTALWCQNKEISSLEGINEFKHIKHIDLAFNNITDLSPLAELQSLESLDLQHNHIENLAPLTKLTNLEQLSLNNNKISDISAINSLEQLLSLNLAHNKLTSIEAMPQSSDLKFLSIAHNQISTLQGINNLTALEHLQLEANPIADITDLPVAHSVKSLRLVSTNQDTLAEELPLIDLSPISKLSGLTELVIKGDNIKDINALASLTQLKELELIAYQVSDIQALDQLKQLEKLNIGSYTTPFSFIPKMNVSTIASLSQLTSLTDLKIKRTKVVDFSPISQLTLLKSLWVLNNENTSFAPFANLTQLETLVFYPNGLITENNIDQLHQLTKLKTFWTVWPEAADSLAILDNMPLITDLYIGGSANQQLSDFSSLANRQLTNFQVSGTQLANVEFLSSMSSLKTLQFQSTKALSDISALSTLTQLEKINLWFNEHLSCEQLDALQNALSSTLIERPNSCVLN
ncbi:leucine-rich repeat domain-containing protein [Thalassotalea marina]|uniref:Leucine-rich repeat domain-containing protein n=1 Tax=Thalassotalea marina TaxID=1673741 RepID=A0A919EM73_9GAMM|nr:leucine-rich repeat domain-containing protein [Thalassotalea marina]GHF94248.1 hypothetical protein GCM10017161_23110 [Thalassotalea marina]